MAIYQTDRTLPIQLSLCCPTLCQDSCFNGTKTFIKPKTFLNSKSVSQWAKCQSVSMQKKIGVSVINKKGTCLWTFSQQESRLNLNRSENDCSQQDSRIRTCPRSFHSGEACWQFYQIGSQTLFCTFVIFLCEESTLASHHYHGHQRNFESTQEKPMLRISTAVGIF